MKITKKKPIKASEAPVGEALIIGNPVIAETCDCKYANAIELISAAIESLAEIARDDEIAKDSIANLGVVMLDLKGGC